MKKKLVILGMITAVLLTGCGDSEEDLKIQAWVCAEDIVEQNLKSPSSADFCSYTDADILNLGDNEYKISGWVDAQNGFGATIRTDFTVTLELTENGYKNGDVVFDQ